MDHCPALADAVASLEVDDAFRAPWDALRWQRLAAAMQRRELAAGELLFARGDRDRVAYFVERGQLQVYVSGGPPGSHRIATLRAGALVGEPGLFADSPRMASVEALVPSSLWALSAGALDVLAATDPRLAFELLRGAGAVMAARMRANLERGIPVS